MKETQDELDFFLDLYKRYFNPDDCKTIIDCGPLSYRKEPLFLQEHFRNASIYCFEPNDFQYNKLVKEKEEVNFNGEIFNCPVGNKTDEVEVYDFTYITYTTKELANLRKSNPLQEYHKKCSTKLKKMYRIEDFCYERKIDSIDILWMDIDGAEEEAIKGLGEMLSNVKVIWTEMRTKLLDDYFDYIDTFQNHFYVNSKWNR